MTPVWIALGILAACAFLVWLLKRSLKTPPAARPENAFLISPEEILASRNVDFIHAAVKAYTHSQRSEAADLMLQLLNYTWEDRPFDDIRMIAAKELEMYSEEHFRDARHLLDCIQALKRELDRVSPKALYHSDLAIAMKRLLKILKTKMDRLVQREYTSLDEVEAAIQSIDETLERLSEPGESDASLRPEHPARSVLTQAQNALQKTVNRFLEYGPPSVSLAAD